MSRSVADFLVKENEFEIEYKKNFSDHFSSDIDSEASVDSFSIQMENKLYLQNRKKKVYQLFCELKQQCNSMGLLQKVNFFDFCLFINEVHLVT